MSEIRKAHKGSVIGRAVSAAAAGRWIESGFEFEYSGTKYRVVEPNHAGLRSYFSYEEVEAEPKAPRLRILYAGSLADLLSKPIKPRESEATDAAGTIPPYLRGILAAMAPEQEPEKCPCGDNDGLQCSLPGCPYTVPSADSPKPEGCPCGFCNGDPDYEEVPGTEDSSQRIEVVSVERKGDLRGASSVSIEVRGTTASYKDEAAAVVAAIASHFGVSDEHLAGKVAKLEAENTRLAGLYDHYRESASASRARAEKLEGIISRIYTVALDAYKDAEIIPF